MIIKRRFSLFICTILWLATLSIEAQVATEIDGSILISNSENENPNPGTIRYNRSNNDYEGWNGHFWASLTGFQTDTVSDIDGNIYKTAIIGDQEWMIENLKTSRYRDGSDIPWLMNINAWANDTNGAYSYYVSNPSYDLIYGKLYNWYAVETQQLCPTGWKVPFEVDWDNLTEYLGGENEAGLYLKEIGTTHWDGTSQEVSNSSGFTSKGGGSRSISGFSFESARSNAHYWALTVGTTSNGTEGAFSRRLSSSNAKFETLIAKKNRGFSVRCIKTN